MGFMKEQNMGFIVLLSHDSVCSSNFIQYHLKNTYVDLAKVYYLESFAIYSFTRLVMLVENIFPD